MPTGLRSLDFSRISGTILRILSAGSSSARQTFTSPTSGSASSFPASKPLTFIERNRTSGCRNSHFEAVVKSVKRVPTPIIKSASFAIVLAALFPVTPMPPRFSGSLPAIQPFPACVSAKGYRRSYKTIEAPALLPNTARRRRKPPRVLRSGNAVYCLFYQRFIRTAALNCVYPLS